jgi:hypothetical protein
MQIFTSAGTFVANIILLLSSVNPPHLPSVTFLLINVLKSSLFFLSCWKKES